MDRLGYEPLNWSKTALRVEKEGRRAVGLVFCGALLGTWLSWLAPHALDQLVHTRVHDIALPEILPADYIGVSPAFYDGFNMSEARGPDCPDDDGPCYSLEEDFRQPVRGKDESELYKVTYRGFGECYSTFKGPVPIANGMIAPPLEPPSSPPSNHCAHWRTGLLHRPNLDLSSEALERARNRTVTIDRRWDAPGNFTEHNLWRPRNAEEGWRHFNPSEMTECLMGKRILIQGDSMMRHVFERFVQLHRGLPTRVGQYHDQGLSEYVVYRNLTDWLNIRGDKAVYQNNLHEHSRGKDREDDVILRVAHDWLFGTDGWNEPLTRVEMLDPDVVIHGSNYWYDKAMDYRPLGPELEAMYSRGVFNGTFGFYQTPPYRLNDYTFTARTGTVRMYAEQSENDKLHIIPSDRIAVAADKRGSPTRNCWMTQNDCGEDLHWSCVRAAYLDYDLPGHGLDWYKAPKGFDCSDPFNLAVIESWLNAICPAKRKA